MTALSFKNDIKGLFSKYLADMDKVKLGTASGTQTLYLGNYDSVKFFYYQIQVAIHGYDYDGAGNLLVLPDERLPVRGGPVSEFVQSAPHPMPPDGKLPQEAINLYDQWVREGMLA